eukprot:687477-Rhodomonas_salina.2
MASKTGALEVPEWATKSSHPGVCLVLVKDDVDDTVANPLSRSAFDIRCLVYDRVCCYQVYPLSDGAGVPPSMPALVPFRVRMLTFRRRSVRHWQGNGKPQYRGLTCDSFPPTRHDSAPGERRASARALRDGRDGGQDRVRVGADAGLGPCCTRTRSPSSSTPPPTAPSSTPCRCDVTTFL